MSDTTKVTVTESNVMVPEHGYICPKHGNVGNFIGLQIDMPGVQRKYCMACWVDLMDAHCGQLTEAPADPE